MKKLIMLIFSIIFAVAALAALLCGVELVLTANGMSLLPQNFWEQAAVAEFLVESEAETAQGFLSGLLVLMGIICLVLHILCSKIGKSLVADGEDVRESLWLSRVAHLVFVLSVPSLILEYIFRGVYDGGFILTCVMFGVPWLVFSVLTVPMSVSILFNDELYEGNPFSGGSGYSYSPRASSSSSSSSKSYSGSQSSASWSSKEAYDRYVARQNRKNSTGEW